MRGLGLFSLPRNNVVRRPSRRCRGGVLALDCTGRHCDGERSPVDIRQPRQGLCLAQDGHPRLITVIAAGSVSVHSKQQPERRV
jgi:hypothetical protein